MRGGLTLTLAFLAIAGTARADAISPPPDECPHGGEPWGSHAGPICSPGAACTESSCGIGTTCEAIAYCVVEGGCGGDRAPDDPCVQRNVVGVCGAGDACPAGTVCYHTRACVAPSGGCTAHPGGRATLGVGLSVLVALVLVTRRRT